MSMQLCLVFDSNDKCEYIARKYKWSDEQYEIIAPEYELCDYCVCIFYGDPGCTYGIGTYECVSEFYSVDQFDQPVSTLTDRKAAEMKAEYEATVLSDIVLWSELIRDNIDYLYGIGFLPHWDVCDFSKVFFSEKQYSQLKMIDLLTVREDEVLWITKN